MRVVPKEEVRNFLYYNECIVDNKYYTLVSGDKCSQTPMDYNVSELFDIFHRLPLTAAICESDIQNYELLPTEFLGEL